MQSPTRPVRLDGVEYYLMGSSVLTGLQELWDDRPGVIVLLVLGMGIFLFLVLDAWRRKPREHK
jgi:hypothetical protein